MVIAIDFDGTCVTHEFPCIGKDIGAAHVLRRLVGNGHKLILFTMRSNDPDIYKGDFLDNAVNWFEKNGIPLWGVQKNPTQDTWTTSPKCYAEMYIDDAGLGIPLKEDLNLSTRPFVDWNKVEKMLEEKGMFAILF